MFSPQEVDDARKTNLRLPHPRMELASDVGGQMFTQVGQSLAYLRGRGSPALEVTINSGGGDVDAGLDIYDMLRSYPGKTTGVVIGRAASMAAIILQACTVRHCTQHAHVLIHHISRRSVTLDQLRNSKRLKTLREEMEESQNRLYKILVERTGQPIKRIRDVCAKDTYMSAHEALRFRLIDKIV